MGMIDPELGHSCPKLHFLAANRCGLSTVPMSLMLLPALGFTNKVCASACFSAEDNEFTRSSSGSPHRRQQRFVPSLLSLCLTSALGSSHDPAAVLSGT